MARAHFVLHNQLREQIKSCTSCSGVGKVLQEGQLVQCTCLRTALSTYRLAVSNIPPKFKALSLSDYIYTESLTYKKVAQYVKALDKAATAGHGLYLYGGPQSGRTLLASSVLKAAVEQGYSVYFETYGSLMTTMHRENSDPVKADTLRKLTSGDVDFVCVDHISEVLERLTNMKTSVLSGQATHGAVTFLESILSRRALLAKPLIMTGSVSMEEISRRFESLGALMTSQLLEAKCENHHQAVQKQQQKRFEDIGWDQLKD